MVTEKPSDPAVAVDLLLHPVRLRIVQTLCGRRLTGREVSAALPDVPQASLYRHLGALVDGGAVQVVEQRRVRNMTERVHAVVEPAVRISQDQAAQLSVEDMSRLFAAFGALLLGQFRQYVDRDSESPPEPGVDGVACWQQVAYLNTTEVTQLSEELHDRLAESQRASTAADKQRRYVYFAALPAAETGDVAAPTNERSSQS